MAWRQEKEGKEEKGEGWKRDEEEGMTHRLSHEEVQEQELLNSSKILCTQKNSLKCRAAMHFTVFCYLILG